MFELIKSIFCNHQHQMFIRNIYDNEFWLGRVFECMQCKKIIYRNVSGEEMEVPKNQSAHLLQHKPK